MNKKVKSIAYGGVLGALIVLFLFFSMWLPTADFALFSLTSLTLAVAVIELGSRTGWILYVTAGLLGIAWPGLAFVWPYLLFFGPYPLLRAIIDRRCRPVAARIIRISIGVLLASLSVILFRIEAVLTLFDQFAVWSWMMIPVGTVVVITIYDLALGMLINLYVNRIKKD